MDALLMCGGRGTRLGGDTEKPLVAIHGRPMVDRVIDAVTDASQIGAVHAVVSPQTSETRAHLVEGRPDVSIVDAPGDGYVSDLQYAIGTVDTPESIDAPESIEPALLTVAADLPLLDGETVDAVVEASRAADAGSLTVCVPVERKRELGVSADTATELDGRAVVPAGINVVGGESGTSDGNEGDAADDADGAGDDTDDSNVHLTGDVRLAVNVNYPSDAQIAERLLANDTHTDS